MKKVGVIGLGDMGSGLAKNLIKHGFSTTGYDLDNARMQAFAELGGEPAANVAEVGEYADAVFVMVMNGDQAKEVILAENSLSKRLKPGSAIVMTATINPAEAVDIGNALQGTGLHFIDTPVSGGFPGAQNGTLTMMMAADPEVMEEFKSVFEAVSANIHHVGTEPGQGQTVKACLQSLIGAIFSASCEATNLAAKAGVPGQVILDVFSTSSAGCGVSNTAIENIIDRQFVDTGSHISTMYKDLTISLDLARELGVPLHTASTAMQLFQSAITKYPEGDNWIIAKVGEDIIGEELHR